MAWYRHVFAKIFIVAVASIALPSFIGSAHAAGYTMSITTSGSRSINVSPRADGVGTSISADNINVHTTCRAGYNLTVSTSVNNNNLYLDGDVANNVSGTFFSPASGSSTLKSSPNTWGYLVSDSTPNENSTFSAVPALGATATIKTPVSSTTDIDDHFNVYYGVSVANGMNTGTYKMIPDTSVTPNRDGAIMYYLTMADACTSYTVQYNPTGADNNGVLRTGTGTMADQYIKEDIATNLSTNTFTAPSGYYFAGWNTAQDGSGTSYTNGQSVTNLENATTGDTVTLYAMWTDCPSDNVCYDEHVTGQTAIRDGSIDLLPTISNKTGYGFAGWNTKKDGTGTKYGPSQTIDVSAGKYDDGGLNLYAMWVEPAKDSSNNELTFQTTDVLNVTLADGETLGSKPNGYVTALKDARDSQVYAIAKLADGNYWMIENLRLGDESELTMTNTNIDTPELSMTNSWYYMDRQDEPVISNHLSPSILPSETAWCAYVSADDELDFAACINQAMVAGGEYGNYYNWYAATAGSGTYEMEYENASRDICPLGWRLPFGGEQNVDKSFSNLSIALGGPESGEAADYSSTPTGEVLSRVFRSYPNNFIYSGQIVGDSFLDDINYGGGYWTSTRYDNEALAYALGLDPYNVYPGRKDNYGTGGGSEKYVGIAVRCVAQ